jgi:hypothetical protein
VWKYTNVVYVVREKRLAELEMEVLDVVVCKDHFDAVTDFLSEQLSRRY